MKEIFGRVIFYIGITIFCVGVCGADSECILIPFGVVIIGFIICRATIKFIDFDDDLTDE